MEILLIRHGEKAYTGETVADFPLTARGVLQAQRTGEALKGEGIEKIYASAMVRAQQTADAINETLHIPIEVSPQLREIDMGLCSYWSRGWDWVRENHPQYYSDFHAHREDLAYLDGECGQDVWRRASPLLYEAAESGLSKVAFVIHGGVIINLLCGIMGVPFEARFAFRGATHCSITRLYALDGRIQIESFNEMGHLGELSDLRFENA